MHDVIDARLAYFVDRDEEMSRFRSMLDGTKRIMTVCGDSGLGKSLLMERMVRECADRGLRTVKVPCRDTRNDALFIMRTLLYGLGTEHFAEFIALVTPREEPQVIVNVNAPITVGTGIQNQGQVGAITGIKVDPVSERPDLARRAAERLVQLTDAFLNGVRSALSTSPAAIFVDDCQKMPLETEQWFRNELLFAVKERQLPQVFFVLLSQKDPDLAAWSYLLQQSQLQPLSRDHIRTYLSKRGINEPDCSTLVRMLYPATQGRPAEIERWVEAYLEEQRRDQP